MSIIIEISISTDVFHMGSPVTAKVIRVCDTFQRSAGGREQPFRYTGWTDADVASKEQHSTAGVKLVLGCCRTIVCNCAPWQLLLVLFAFLNKFRLLLFREKKKKKERHLLHSLDFE